MELRDHPAFVSLGHICALARTYSLIEKTNVFLFQWSQIILKVTHEGIGCDLIAWFDSVAEILVHASSRNGYEIMQVIVGKG